MVISSITKKRTKAPTNVASITRIERSLIHMREMRPVIKAPMPQTPAPARGRKYMNRMGGCSSINKKEAFILIIKLKSMREIKNAHSSHTAHLPSLEIGTPTNLFTCVSSSTCENDCNSNSITSYLIDCNKHNEMYC